MKKYQLPKEFAEKWVAALRSGEYRRTRGMMITYCNGEPGYCALGISAKIAGFRDSEINSKMSVTPTMQKLNANYPIELTGNYRINKLVKEIATMNDLKALTFTEIADWITDNVEFI